MDSAQQQQQQQQLPQGMAPQGQAPNPEPEGLRNLMVNYIPTTIDELQLRQIFEQYGPIEMVKIVCDRETRQSRGYGFVKFRQASNAAQAIQELNGYPILNKRLKVALANHDQHQARQTTQPNPYAAYAAQMNPYAAQLQAQQAMMLQYQQYQQYLMQQAAAQQQAAQQQQRR